MGLQWAALVGTPCPMHTLSLLGNTRSCRDTARGEAVTGLQFGTALPCLTPSWILLQNNMALQENPKVAAARKEAPSPACTCNPHHCSHPHHCSRHRLGQPRTVRGGCHLPASRREQKISSGTVVTGQDFSRISTSGAIAAAKPCESRLIMRAGLRDLEPGPCLAPASQAFKRDSDFLRLKQP